MAAVVAKCIIRMIQSRKRRYVSSWTNLSIYRQRRKGRAGAKLAAWHAIGPMRLDGAVAEVDTL